MCEIIIKDGNVEIDGSEVENSFLEILIRIFAPVFFLSVTGLTLLGVAIALLSPVIIVAAALIFIL